MRRWERKISMRLQCACKVQQSRDLLASCSLQPASVLCLYLLGANSHRPATARWWLTAKILALQVSQLQARVGDSSGCRVFPPCCMGLHGGAGQYLVRHALSHPDLK